MSAEQLQDTEEVETLNFVVPERDGNLSVTIHNPTIEEIRGPALQDWIEKMPISQ
jgi:hypothetical protein